MEDQGGDAGVGAEQLVDRSVGEAEIKKAFRQLARKLHPDVSEAPDADERFKEVVAILRRAYGPRLRAVTPTPESEMYLYGDRLGAPRTVEGLNEGLRGGSAA